MSGKPGTQPVVIGADQRIVAQQVDVIAEQNQITRIPERVHPAAGVGDNQGRCPERAHHPDGKGHLSEAVALVPVKAALHGHHRALPQAAEQQPARM